MNAMARISMLFRRKNTWIRRAVLVSSVIVALGYANYADGDSKDAHHVQLEIKPAATAGSPSEESQETKPREKEERPQDKKIRMRGLDPEQSPSPVPTPVEKSPSIDPDAQKGLLDRMKGCCGEPKN